MIQSPEINEPPKIQEKQPDKIKIKNIHQQQEPTSVQIVRSEQLTNKYLFNYLRQQNYLCYIINKGFHGMTLYDLNNEIQNLVKRKKHIEDQVQNKDKTKKQILLENKQFVYEKFDGIFNQDNLTRQDKLLINRYIQRAIYYYQNDGYFEENGDLSLNFDMFNRKLQKIMFISFQENPQYAIYRRSAFLCERINQSRQQPFELNILIGKIILTKHPLFNNEDKQVQILKQLIQKYQAKSNKAILPHCKKLMQVIEIEMHNLKQLDIVPEEQLEILQNEYQNQEAIKNNEEQEIYALGEEIIQNWEKVKDLREQQALQPYRLQVKKYSTSDGSQETEFFLTKQKISEENLTQNELSRIKSIRKQKICIELFINNRKVQSTTPVYLQWPEFEAQFFKKFELLLYSKPSSIYLKIYLKGLIGKTLIDTVQLDIPGENVKTITSSEKITNYAHFEQGLHKFNTNQQKNLEKEIKKEKEKLEKQKKIEEQEKLKERKANQNDEENKKLNEENSEADSQVQLEELLQQQKQLDQQAQNKVKEKQKEAEEFVRKTSQYGGLVSYLNEWEGLGPKMPPEKLENLVHGQLQQIAEEDKEQILNFDEKGLHFDVNDPKFFDQLMKIKSQEQHSREEGGQYLLPGHDQVSLRQILLKIRQMKSYLDVPVSEQYISPDINPQLLELIKDYERQEVEHDDEDKEIYEGYLMPKISDYQKQDTLFRINVLKKKLENKSKEFSLKKQQNQYSGITYNNLVDEYNLPKEQYNIPALLKEYFRQKRKLMPKQTSQRLKKTNELQQFNLNVYISHGENVPVREESNIPAMKDNILQNLATANLKAREYLDQIRDMREQNMMLEASIDVLSYVDIKLVINNKQDQQRTSKRSQGFQPNFNTELEPITIKPERNQQFSVEELEQLNHQNSFIQVSLFDHTQDFKPKNEHKATYMINKYYLGSFTVPIRTILTNQRMNYTFKVQRPLIIFGYYIQEEKNENTHIQDNSNKKNLTPTIPTTINMSISLDPMFETPKNDKANFFSGNENNSLLQYGAKWLQSIRQHKVYGKRHISLWGEDSNQHSIFYPRYCHPCAPHFSDDIEEDRDPIEKAARFVSLIPFKNDSEIFNDLPDIFCNTQEFIDLKGGDYEEHAIALHNYFSYIDKKLGHDRIQSYVVLGDGVPEGKTFYVLRIMYPAGKDQNIQAEIWNPKTGDAYNINTKKIFTRFFGVKISESKSVVHDKFDLACPLYSVGCVFDCDNVYINTQKQQAPQEIDWNIKNKKKWKPFLDNKQKQLFYPDGVKTIQPEEIKYDLADKDTGQLQYIENLRIAIQNQIKQEILNQRTQRGYLTSFNDSLEADITNEVLTKLESIKYTCRMSGLNSKLRGQDQNKKENDAIQDLSWVCDSLNQKARNLRKRIYGFPLNFTFTDFNKIWQEVDATGITTEIIQKELDQIIVSVRCFGHTNYIVSVWIFLAILQEESPYLN